LATADTKTANAKNMYGVNSNNVSLIKDFVLSHWRVVWVMVL